VRDELALVRFIAERYHVLRGLMAVALGVAIAAAAPLLSGEWTVRAGVSLGLILAGLAAAAVFIGRYYENTFGRARPTMKEKRRPWYAALTFVALENIGRRLTLRGTEMAILAIGLAAALGFQAVKDWRFRKHALIIPAVLAFIGLDRLAGPGNLDPWVWLRQSTLLLAGAVVLQGVADHLLLSHALSAGTRRLATSALPLAAVSDGSAAAASEPATAVILTALTSCQEADFRFLASIAGLDSAEASTRIQALRNADLIGIEEHGRGARRIQFARLSIKGQDVAAHLWPN
jgi:hypothetical protein